MENHEISSNVNDDVIINIMPITNLLCDTLERADIMKELIPKQEIMDNTVGPHLGISQFPVSDRLTPRAV